MTQHTKALANARRKAQVKYAKARATKISSGAFVTAARRELTEILRDCESGYIGSVRKVPKIREFLFNRLNAFGSGGSQFTMWITSATNYLDAVLRVTSKPGWSDKRGATDKVEEALRDAIASLSSADVEWRNIGSQVQHNINQGDPVADQKPWQGDDKRFLQLLHSQAQHFLARLQNGDMPTSLELDKMRTAIQQRSASAQGEAMGILFEAKLALNKAIYAQSKPAMTEAMRKLVTALTEWRTL